MGLTVLAAERPLAHLFADKASVMAAPTANLSDISGPQGPGAGRDRTSVMDVFASVAIAEPLIRVDPAPKTGSPATGQMPATMKAQDAPKAGEFDPGAAQKMATNNTRMSNNNQAIAQREAQLRAAGPGQGAAPGSNSAGLARVTASEIFAGAAMAVAARPAATPAAPAALAQVRSEPAPTGKAARRETVMGPTMQTASLAETMRVQMTGDAGTRGGAYATAPMASAPAKPGKPSGLDIAEAATTTSLTLKNPGRVAVNEHDPALRALYTQRDAIANFRSAMRGWQQNGVSVASVVEKNGAPGVESGRRIAQIEALDPGQRELVRQTAPQLMAARVKPSLPSMG